MNAPLTPFAVDVAELIKYCEEHGWGNMPEPGETLDRIKAVIGNAYEEPWDRITNYGDVNMTVHSVLRRVYRVACLIERCGASPELTHASSAAFDLVKEVYDALQGAAK